MTYPPDDRRPEDDEPARKDGSGNGNGRSSNGQGNSVLYDVPPDLLAETQEAIRAQLERDSLSEPDAVDPLEIGPQRPQDPRLWGDALRDYLLPEKEQQYLDNSTNDPEFRRTIESMATRPIPGRGL